MHGIRRSSRATRVHKTHIFREIQISNLNVTGTLMRGFSLRFSSSNNKRNNNGHTVTCYDSSNGMMVMKPGWSKV